MHAPFQMVRKALDKEEGKVRGALCYIWRSEEARAQGGCSLRGLLGGGGEHGLALQVPRPERPSVPGEVRRWVPPEPEA